MYNRSWSNIFSVCVQYVCYVIKMHESQWKPTCQILPFLTVCHCSTDGICIDDHSSFAPAGSLTHFVPSAPACDIQRGWRKGQWSTRCVWIFAPQKLFELPSFGIIHTELPCHSQNGNQVSVKLLPNNAWTQMPHDIQTLLGHFLHGRQFLLND